MMLKNGQNTIQIVDAEATHARLLRDLGEQTFREAYAAQSDPREMDFYVGETFTLENILAELENDQSRFFLLQYAGEWAGYALVRWDQTHEKLPDEHAMMLHRIYLLRRFWGLGLGKNLLEHIVQFAQAEGYDWLWLSTWDQNKRAIEFYLKAGFEHFGYYQFCFGNEVHNDWAMRKRLKNSRSA